MCPLRVLCVCVRCVVSVSLCVVDNVWFDMCHCVASFFFVVRGSSFGRQLNVALLLQLQSASW